MLRTVFIILILSLLSNAWAYPVFFRCDDKKQMTEFLAGQDLLDSLKKLQASMGGDRSKLLATLCEGKIECERQFSQILELASISEAAANAEQKKVLTRLQNEMANSPIVSTDEATIKLETEIRKLSAEINSCRQVTSSLDPDAWEKNSCVTFYYPIKNEYSYAGTFRATSSKAMRNGCAQKDLLQTSIQEALLTGVDPLVYLSIGLMEEGHEGWRQVGLDPIGVISAIGCASKQNSSNANLKSYGNGYVITPKHVKNTVAANNIKKIINNQNPGSVKPGKSYYCAEFAPGRFNERMVEKPVPGECCLLLDFVAEHEDVTKGLKLSYIESIQKSHPEGLKDPASRIQMFNGRSKLMGGGEAVPVFRSGVNYFDSPAYGYQAMDFIINNLAANPWLTREIKRQKENLKLSTLPPSILCQEEKAGPNVIDSKHYFDLHRNSKRMLLIKNLPYSKIKTNPRHKQVMVNELAHVIEAGLFPAAINGKAVPTKFELTFDAAKSTEHYVVKELTTSEGKTELLADRLLEEKKLSEVLDLQKAAKGVAYTDGEVSYTLTPIGNSSLDFPADFYDELHNPMGIKTHTSPPYQLIYPGIGTITQGADGESTCVLDPKNPLSKSKSADACFLIQKQTGLKNISYEIKKSDGTGYHVEIKPLSSGSAVAKKQRIAYGNSLNSKEWVQIETNNRSILLDDKKQPFDPNKLKGLVSRDELVDYYFKNIYKKRDTIEKASSFGPWKSYSDEEFERILKKASEPFELPRMK